MDAMEGRGVSGGGFKVPIKRTGGTGTTWVGSGWAAAREAAGTAKAGGAGWPGSGRRRGELQGREALERLLEKIRMDVDAAVEQKAAAFEGVRSEVVLRRVLAKVQEGRQRGAWLLRAMRTMTAMGVALWNSRAVRMLMP